MSGAPGRVGKSPKFGCLILTHLIAGPALSPPDRPEANHGTLAASGRRRVASRKPQAGPLESTPRRVHANILETIGNTPLVRLNKVTRGLDSPIYAKLEYFNPGGSVKDRIAERMLESHERSGVLRPGGIGVWGAPPPGRRRTIRPPIPRSPIGSPGNLPTPCWPTSITPPPIRRATTCPP